MRAYEIPVKVTMEGTLEWPDALLTLLPRGQLVRAIVLVPEPAEQEEHAAWSRLTAEQFLAGYSAADAVYDRV